MTISVVQIENGIEVEHTAIVYKKNIIDTSICNFILHTKK